MSSSSSSSSEAAASSSSLYSVELPLPPLGIVFEERDPVGFNGVVVTALTTGGAGERCGKIQIGDVLTKTSAVRIIPGSSKFEIVNVDTTKLDFDTIVDAIGSNSEKFSCDRVSLTFERSRSEEGDAKTEELDPREPKRQRMKNKLEEKEVNE